MFTKEYADALIAWYRESHRVLPWRMTHDPYRIWISEIMLQQTRVEAVIEKYNLFTTVLPTIQDLAKVEDDALMKLWEGLGYYSRARNLKKCAIEVVSEYNGNLPDDPSLLLELPGIGPYTSGAICSIAYGHGAAAVDGNVLRVLARLFGITDDIKEQKTHKKFENILNTFYKEHVLSKEEVRYLTQGFMDLGATICVPNGIPKCESCPWNAYCIAHHNNSTDRIPVRAKAKERRVEKRTILLLRDGRHYLLKKRPEKGLLAGLYEFPNLENHLSRKEVIDTVQEMGYEPVKIKVLPKAKHIFSHIEWHMIGYEVQVTQIHDTDGLLADIDHMQEYAIPSAYASYHKLLY